MGREYMAAIVGGYIPGLSYNAFRVLARMATVVLDYDDETKKEYAGIYYGGWKALAYIFTGHVYDRNRDPLPPAVEQKVRRAIAELREGGYIEPAPPDAQRGYSHRVYRIDLGAIKTPGLDV